MPYSMKENVSAGDKFMEKCVMDITGTNKRTGKPYTKGEKIAICKAQYENKGKASLDEEIIIDPKIFEQLDNYKVAYIEKIRGMLKVDYETAEAMFDVHLARNNYDYQHAMATTKFL